MRAAAAGSSGGSSAGAAGGAAAGSTGGAAASLAAEAGRLLKAAASTADSDAALWGHYARFFHAVGDPTGEAQALAKQARFSTTPIA